MYLREWKNIACTRHRNNNKNMRAREHGCGRDMVNNARAKIERARAHALVAAATREIEKSG